MHRGLIGAFCAFSVYYEEGEHAQVSTLVVARLIGCFAGILPPLGIGSNTPVPAFLGREGLSLDDDGHA